MAANISVQFWFNKEITIWFRFDTLVTCISFFVLLAFKLLHLHVAHGTLSTVHSLLASSFAALCCSLRAVVPCAVLLRKRPKYNTSSLHQKLCLIEETRKSAGMKTKLAKKHNVPPLTLHISPKNDSKIVEAYGKKRFSKHSQM